MNIVETVAPISIENLKKFFTDKTTYFVISYKDSALKGTKLLTYLSNLDIPCDINLNGATKEECFDLIKDYLNCSMIVNVPSLEHFTIQLLKQYKNITEQFDKDFIESNEQILRTWVDKLDSLTLYNMSIISTDEFKKFAEGFPKDDTDDLTGVNFVSLLKRPEFYELYGKIEKESLKYYTHYFNDYMFKGKNLYSYWANENNPLFLLTYGITENLFTPEEYVEAKKQSLEELANATPV